jgi:hypothetical protein
MVTVIAPAAKAGAGSPTLTVTGVVNALDIYRVPELAAENSPYPKIVPQFADGSAN